MNKRLKKCPVCNNDLEVVEYKCPNCDTSIRGNFRVGDFAALSQEQQEFAKVFLCCQGNIKEVEKTLKISYPTVKNRLAEVVNVLCPTQRKKEEKNYSSLLEKIDSGEISVEKALKELENK